MFFQLELKKCNLGTPKALYSIRKVSVEKPEEVRRSRACPKSLLEPIRIDDLFELYKPFHRSLSALFVHIGQGFRGKWLQKPMQSQQWIMALQAFSDTLYYSDLHRIASLSGLSNPVIRQSPKPEQDGFSQLEKPSCSGYAIT